MKNQAMIFVHEPGADNMTFFQRISHICQYGIIKFCIVTQRDAHTIPIAGIIAWYFDPNKPINQQNGQQSEH